MTPKPPRRVLRAMQRALDRMPDPDRAIFVRVRFLGEDYRCIALDLGLSVPEIERGLVRALIALDAAARSAERRRFRSRFAPVCAWLRAHLPQGWRR